MNGATCINIRGDFQCLCPPQWTGKLCSIGKLSLYVNSLFVSSLSVSNQMPRQYMPFSYRCFYPPEWTSKRYDVYTDFPSNLKF